MSRKIFITISMLFLAFSVISQGCSGGGGGDTGPTTVVTPCGPDQQLGKYTSVWTYVNCGPFDQLYVYHDQPDFNGVVLGSTPVGKGMISVRYTGLLNEFMYRTPTPTFGLFFMANGNNQQEVNWQWFSSRISADTIISTLRSQRFDGNCIGQEICESNEYTTQIQFVNDREVYQWDCWWDDAEGAQGTIQCAVSRLSDNRRLVLLTVFTAGPYNELIYMGFGNKAFDGVYPGYQGIVSDLKITIFQ